MSPLLVGCAMIGLLLFLTGSSGKPMESDKTRKERLEKLRSGNGSGAISINIYQGTSGPGKKDDREEITITQPKKGD